MKSKLFSGGTQYKNNCEILCSVIGVIPQKDATYETTWRAFELGDSIIATTHFVSSDYRGWNNAPLSQTLKSQMVALFNLFAYKDPQLDIFGIDRFLLTNESEYNVLFLSDITERIRKPTADEFVTFWGTFRKRKFTVADMKLIPGVIENMINQLNVPMNYFSNIAISLNFIDNPLYFTLVNTISKIVNIGTLSNEIISILCRGRRGYPNFELRIYRGEIPLLNIDLIKKYYGTDSVFESSLLYYKYLFFNFVDSGGAFDVIVLHRILISSILME